MHTTQTRLDRLDEVRNLNLWGQDLDDVSIVGRMPQVEVLSLSVNRIATLRDFRHCKALRELYLRKNEIMDITEILYLQPCTQVGHRGWVVQGRRARSAGRGWWQWRG